MELMNTYIYGNGAKRSSCPKAKRVDVPSFLPIIRVGPAEVPMLLLIGDASLNITYILGCM